MRILIASSLSLLISTPLLLHADIIAVPAEQPTIQDGIDAAVSGDEVLVSPGTYVENIDYLGKSITVRSTDGAGVTTIDGSDGGSTVLLFADDGVLDGFTITNGLATIGGGVHVGGATPSVTNCIIRDNGAELGGGIYVLAGSALIAGNIIDSNVAFGPFVSNGYGGGIYVASGAPLISNNTIYGNVVGFAGLVIEQGPGIYASTAGPVIINNIIRENAGLGPDVWGFPIPPTVENCAIQGSYPFGSRNIISDPLLADPENGDFHLLECSPCIDRGVVPFFELPVTDFEGDPRLDGITVDIGADEAVGVVGLCTPLFRRGDANGDGAITLADPITNLEYQFAGGPATCLDSLDDDDSGTITLADPVLNLGFQFSGGPPPAPPFVGCGEDLTADALDCAEHEGCP